MYRFLNAHTDILKDISYALIVTASVTIFFIFFIDYQNFSALKVICASVSLVILNMIGFIRGAFWVVKNT